MSAKKRRQTPEQPELPMAESQPATPPGPKAKSDKAGHRNGSAPPAGHGPGHGNGDAHVHVEPVPTAPHHPFAPGKIDLPLHRRVDTNFLQYASYVIRDRAIPNLEDGLKPVQRRILWTLHEEDDGRLIKVATISGSCMKYHPHGEAAIADALVVMANKRYLLDRQGNFGNIFTGDPAAASRYIEVRLTELARTELF